MSKQLEDKLIELQEKSEKVKPRFPFISILTLLFVAAKLFGYIDWSWWWVFSPIWIQAVIVLVLLVVFGVGSLIAFKLFE
jgi:hypothetical protein